MKTDKSTNNKISIDETYEILIETFNSVKDVVTLIFAEIEDLEIIILKGHLLIENTLEVNLKLLLGQANVSNLKLRFEQKLLLFHYLDCRMTRDGIETSALYLILKSINILRNSIAHKLDLNHDELEFLLSEHDRLTIKGYAYYLPKSNDFLSNNNKLKRLISECVFSLNLSGHKHWIDLKSSAKIL
jgi:hypothetical protein